MAMRKTADPRIGRLRSQSVRDVAIVGIIALALASTGCTSLLYKDQGARFAKSSIGFRKQAANYGAVGSDPEKCRTALSRDGFRISPLRANQLPKTPDALYGFLAVEWIPLAPQIPWAWGRDAYWTVEVIYRKNRILSYKPEFESYISLDL